MATFKEVGSFYVQEELRLHRIKTIQGSLAIEKSTPQTMREKVLLQIRNSPNITRNELASVLGLTSDGIKYHLQKLIKEGIIIHKGSTRSGYWEIVDHS